MMQLAIEYFSMRSPLFTLGLLLMSALFVREIFLLPDGALHLHIFDIGQGDAMLVVTPTGSQIVIDGGPNLSLLEHLGDYMPFTDRTIELLILSHPDADHITALPSVLQRYNVKRVLMNGAIHHSGRYHAFLARIEESGAQVLFPDPEVDLVFGDGVTLDVIWPTPDSIGTDPASANNPSVVFRLFYKEHSILMTGDIERSAEEAILATGADIQSDILKVAHHGSRTSSSTGFLLAVAPGLALISAGRDNPFGHPHTDVVDRFGALGIPMRSTHKEGAISLTFQ